MSDIKSLLTTLLSAQSSIEDVNKAMDELGKVKFDDKATLKQIKNAENLVKAKKNQILATEELNKVEAEALALKRKQEELSADEVKKLEELESQYSKISNSVEKYTEVIRKSGEEVLKVEQLQQKAALEEKERRIEQWKSATASGKAYSVLTSKIAQMTAGVGLATLGMKALTRFTDAARLRNDMMIASYGDLKDSLGTAAIDTMKYEGAMRNAQATAAYLGMSTHEVGQTMIRYQKIVGNAGPEALGKLTEATMSVAKVMGIDTAEAINYVQNRMDNFGGTAEDAIKSLHELRSETKMYNTELAGVKIRGDDVVKVIQDISNSNDVYAVDQRFLSQTLMRTSATLQAQGESYNYAQKMAESYTKALSSDAPEWMKITNSFDIAKEVVKNMEVTEGEGGKMVKSLTTDMADKLDAAKPGLSKKVNDLLNAGYSDYDTTRLLGDVLGDTEVGMSLMSKKIVDLGKSSITALAKQYGVSHMKAEEMYQAAVKTQELEKNKAVFAGKESDSKTALVKKMKDVLGVSDELLLKAQTDKALQDSLLKQYSDKNALLTIQEEKTKSISEANKQILELEIKKTKKQKELSLAKAQGRDGDVAVYEQELKTIDESISKAKSLKDKLSGVEDAEVGKTDGLDKMTEGVKDDQQATSILTGDIFKSWMEKLSNPMALLSVGALAYFAADGVAQAAQTAFLAKIATGQGLFKSSLEALKAGGSKTLGNLAIKGVSTKLLLAGIGAGFAAYDEYQESKEKGNSTGTSVAKAGLAGGVALAGGLAGAKAGALVGALAGPVGSVVGAAVGGALGAWGGSNASKIISDDKKTTKAPSAKTRDALIKTNTQQATQQATQVQKAIQTQKVDDAKPIKTQQEQKTDNGMDLSSMGSLNPDGTLTLKIDNFMNIYAQARMMENSKK